MNAPLVLVIEDDRDVALLIRLHLERGGYLVAVANDAADGVATARELRPDLVLLDFVLGDQSAPAVLRDLSTDESTSDIPVLVVTGRKEREAHEAARTSGACGVLTKPFNMVRLLDTVNRALTGEQFWHSGDAIVSADYEASIVAQHQPTRESAPADSAAGQVVGAR